MNSIPRDYSPQPGSAAPALIPTCWYILHPMARFIAAAIVILTLIGAWNDYLLP